MTEEVDTQAEIRRVFVNLTPLAISSLVDILVDTTSSKSLKARVATTILEFGWGKPSSSSTIEKSTELHIILDSRMRDKLDEALTRAKLLMKTYTALPETKALLENDVDNAV